MKLGLILHKNCYQGPLNHTKKGTKTKGKIYRKIFEKGNVNKYTNQMQIISRNKTKIHLMEEKK